MISILRQLRRKTATPIAERRGSIEDPHVPLTAKNLAQYWGWSNESRSGVNVTEEGTLGNPAIWRGVSLISQGAANLPLVVFRRLPEGGKERDFAHPSYTLLAEQASPSMTAFDLIQVTTAKAILRGNGYVQIKRLDYGLPVALVPLSSDSTRPAYREDGSVVYLHNYRVGDRYRTAVLTVDEVIHIKGLHLDATGLSGLSLVETLRDELGLGIAAQRYGSVFFKNSGRPGMIIEVPFRFRSQEDVDQFRERWGDVHSGLDNAHKPAILEAGAKANPLSVNNEDAQWLQLREFEVRQVANMLGIPASKLADSSRSAYNSLEMDNRSYLEDSLSPWLTKWEVECRRKMLAPAEYANRTHTVEFVLEKLLRTDKKTESEILIQELNNGVLTLNQVLAVKNLPAVEGGDVYRLPTSVTIQDEEDAEQEPEDEDEEETEPVAETDSEPEQETDTEDERAAKLLGTAHRQLERELARHYRRLAQHVRRASRKPTDWREWVRTMLDKETPVLASAIHGALVTRAVLILGSTDCDSERVATGLLSEVLSRIKERAYVVPEALLPGVVDEFAQEMESGFAAAAAGRIFEGSTV